MCTLRAAHMSLHMARAWLKSFLSLQTVRPLLKVRPPLGPPRLAEPDQITPLALTLLRVKVLPMMRILECMIAPFSPDRQARLLPFWQILKDELRNLEELSAFCSERDSFDCEALPWMTRTVTPAYAAAMRVRPTRWEFSIREIDR